MPIKDKADFEPQNLIAIIGEGGSVLSLSKKQTIFWQGDAADAIFYIQKGKVRLTVISKTGKAATFGILREGQFFGESALAGQRRRVASASTLTDCELLRIGKRAMTRALQRERRFTDVFLAYLLAQNIRYEEDLVDQLFNFSEQRLARILLLLAPFGKENPPETVLPNITQETLAEMVGTTRSRINFFMNKFRELGMVDCGPSGLRVHRSRLNAILND